MPRTVQEYEDGVRRGDYPESPTVTPESAIVGIDVDSMAGSGTSVFADFGDAVCWFWRVCEDHYAAGDNSWIPDEQAPPQLREGRARFRTLLDRFVKDGYMGDMAKELHDTVFDVLGGNWAVGGYEVSDVDVLPGDLERVLEAFGNPLVDEDDEDSVLTPAPKFDLANPEHFEALRQRLEEATQ